MTNAQLQKLAIEWQRLLRVQDWDVTVRFARPTDMQQPGLYGQCQAMAVNKEARILICDPRQVPDPLDPEYVLIHEMSHLLLDPLATQKNILYVEQALHGFGHGLFALRKGGKK